jgi:hypothetical protein
MEWLWKLIPPGEKWRISLTQASSSLVLDESLPIPMMPTCFRSVCPTHFAFAIPSGLWIKAGSGKLPVDCESRRYQILGFNVGERISHHWRITSLSLILSDPLKLLVRPAVARHAIERYALVPFPREREDQSSPVKPRLIKSRLNEVPKR